MFLRVESVGSTLMFFLAEIVVAALRINSLDSFINLIFKTFANNFMRNSFIICVIISGLSSFSRFSIANSLASSVFSYL